LLQENRKTKQRERKKEIANYFQYELKGGKEGKREELHCMRWVFKG
jgi:hypothetical protein